MDNYDNFIFYGSWRKVLEGIASSQGKDYAKEVLWNIMLMSTAGDIETDDPFIINFIEGVILPVVDAARERYDRAKKGGQKGGRPALLTEEQNKEIAAMRSQGLKQTEIAKAFDVSVDTIRRSFGWQNWQNYLAKPAKVLPVLLGEKQQNLAKPSSKMQNPYKYIYNYNYKDTYTSAALPAGSPSDRTTLILPFGMYDSKERVEFYITQYPCNKGQVEEKIKETNGNYLEVEKWISETFSIDFVRSAPSK